MFGFRCIFRTTNIGHPITKIENENQTTTIEQRNLKLTTNE
jgi:hypothetical protein